MISLGYNTFKIKSFTAQELNLPVINGENYTVERHQKYFHICYIPFFSLGQFWAIRQNNNQLYKMDPAFERDLDARHKFRTPWYTFIGPIAAVAILILIAISTFSENVARDNREEKYFTEKLNEIQKSFNSPTTADYYTFEPVGSYGDRFYKVINVTKDSLTLQAGDSAMDYSNLYTLYDVFKDSILGPVVKVSRKDLEKTICKDFSVYGSFKGAIIPGMGGDALELEAIKRMPGAEWNLYSGSLNSMGADVSFENEGFDVTIEKIIPIEGPKSWTLELPWKWVHGDKFTLKSSEAANRFRLEIHCLDSLKNKIVYEAWGMQSGYLSDFGVTLKE